MGWLQSGWRGNAGVFVLALLVRLVFLFGVDQPLLYAHQYQYYGSALEILDQPDPLRYILYEEEWRIQYGGWTVAPGYYLFLVGFFGLLGPKLLALQLFQAFLGSLTSVAVGLLGRSAAGPRGLWAGVAYALYWPAIEICGATLTENLHGFLLLGALVALLAQAERPRCLPLLGIGAVLGASALVRSVSSAFVGILGLWLWRRAGWRRGLLLAVCLGGGAAAVVLPWSARNAWLAGDAVPIETFAYENLWYANALVERGEFLRQKEMIEGLPTPAERRRAAVHFALRGVREHPSEFLRKVRSNFWHFVRPEGLHSTLRLEASLEPWRQLVTLLLDDLPLLVAIPPLLVFLVAGRASPARALIGLWTLYFLTMVVVVFFNEIRYRQAFVPFLFAGAAGGIAVLADRAARRRPRTLLALGAGLAVSAGALQPFAAPAWRAARSYPLLRELNGAALSVDELRRVADEATALAPGSTRPWLALGGRLFELGRYDDALGAYQEAARRALPGCWLPRLAIAQLLPLVDADSERIRHARRDVDRLAWDLDPWLLQEAAWRELPAPRSDRLQLARGDYGAVRGFLHPRDVGLLHRVLWRKYEAPGPVPPPGPHRWTRSRAFIRLSPLTPADSYSVTLEMGAPFPSTLRSPTVHVRVNDGPAVPLVLDDTIRPYTVRGPRRPGQPLLIRIDAPTWSRVGEPADQGIRVDRVRVGPAEP